MVKDLIVGVVDNYKWDKIKYWANSIERSGFKGNKALIVYNMDDIDTVKRLTNKGFMLISADKYDEEKGFTYSYASNRIMVDRFLHIYNFLSLFGVANDIDNVIVTDVRDVVFQSNPSHWLEDNLTLADKLIVGSENLRYKDEPWGANNMKESFGPYLYEQMEDEEIFCAGVIAGKYATLKDFCLNLWLICRSMPQQIPGGGGPDQAAMNLLLAMEHIAHLTYRTNPIDGWVVHAGTSMPAIENGSGGIGQAYKQNPKMDLPFIHEIDYTTELGQVYANGTKLTILHQWDRVPYWSKLVEENYGDQ